MPYKISGTKSETGRVIVLKESDWSIESNTVISGSGAYEVDSLEVGDKLVFARDEDGQIVGFAAVAAVEYMPPGARGVFGGGYSGGLLNVIDYITITTPGNAIDFGDLTGATQYVSACSNGVNDRGVFQGYLILDYITISTTGDATDFGDMTESMYGMSACSNGTNDRGIFAAPNYAGVEYNIIEYITISTPGVSTDFGDLTMRRYYGAACSNGTNERGVIAGGYMNPTYYNVIDYITISSLGDATDFGDLHTKMDRLASCSNGTNDRGIFAGGRADGTLYNNIIEYITISTPSTTATDFGDLTTARYGLAGTSNGTNERGVFSGTSASDKNTIDYITISTLGAAIDFGDLTTERDYPGATSNA